MNTTKSVLGVLGCVGLGLQTQHSERPAAAGLCGVCVGCVGFGVARAHACDLLQRLNGANEARKNCYARTEKPNKPNTLNTVALKALIYKGFKCVGFVLGWRFCVGLGGRA